jgi:2-polyprenyl-6-methoxyphenol hydroxylase-like FAD-dependent oxidoreductase
MVKDRQPLAPIASYRFAANRHCHYEKLKAFPAGYLVMGDAVCSFNPIYGQGMSVALSEAQALDDCLATGDGALAERFFREVTRIVASPWAIATGEDYRYPRSSAGARRALPLSAATWRAPTAPPRTTRWCCIASSKSRACLPRRPP